MIIKTDKSEFADYLVDASNFKGNCTKVIFPESTNEIIKIVTDCNENLKKITVSGARTGLTGGAVPKEGILLSLEKLNKIINIDTINKTIRVQPGVRLIDIQETVREYKLFYPPDPTETNCSIGGTLATNASGARTFKYGATRNFVKSIDVVLPSGKFLKIKRGKYFFKNNRFNDLGLKISLPEYSAPMVKNAAGYYIKPEMDLIDLFIGSEGTLGIITELELQLLDEPQNILSMMVFFEEHNDIIPCVNFLRTTSENKNELIDLCEIEFFDKNSLVLLRKDYPNIPSNANGALWLEQHYDIENEDKLFLELENIIKKFNGDVENIWFASDKVERKKIADFRHKIPLLVNEIINSRNLVKIGTDTAVPHNYFAEFYSKTTSLIESNYFDYVVYGHIGNSHLHFNILPKDKKELELARGLYADICRLSTSLGGTISAEHGIGKLKTMYFKEMIGSEILKGMKNIKQIFDPNMLLNIGNIFNENYLNEK